MAPSRAVHKSDAVRPVKCSEGIFGPRQSAAWGEKTPLGKFIEWEVVPGRVAGVICDRANRRRTRKYVEDSRPSKAPQMRGPGPPQPQ